MPQLRIGYDLITTVAENEALDLSFPPAQFTPTAATLRGYLEGIDNALIKNRTDATAPPTVNDDSSGNYSAGSIWIDVSSNQGYFCVDATVGAAIWLSITSLLNKYDGTTAPTATDDSGSGYSVGSFWVDITNDKGYLCIDDADSAAVWIEITGGGGLLNKYDGTAAPTATDDSGSGYSVGSFWVDITNDKGYLCVDDADSAAVWIEITGGGGLLNKYDGTAAPTATDDSGSGYSVGSFWVDITNDKGYLCVDDADSAAVWIEITGGGGLLNKYDGTAAPTATDDSGSGYSVGSFWVDITNDKGYLCVDDADSAAVWIEITGGGGGGGHTIQDDGSPLTQRTNLNFVGFTVTDDAGNDATKVDNPSVTGLNFVGDWTAQAYSQNDAVFHAASQGNWVASATTTSGDVPGVSLKWSQLILGDPNQDLVLKGLLVR